MSFSYVCGTTLRQRLSLRGLSGDYTCLREAAWSNGRGRRSRTRGGASQSQSQAEVRLRPSVPPVRSRRVEDYPERRTRSIVDLRGVYGKSKMIRFNQDWRTKREIAGGGILLDQGIHMVDMMRLFAGDFVDIHAYVSNAFWCHDVEDNATY